MKKYSLLTVSYIIASLIMLFLACVHNHPITWIIATVCVLLTWLFIDHDKNMDTE